MPVNVQTFLTFLMSRSRPNSTRHRIAARLRFGMNPKGHGLAARAVRFGVSRFKKVNLSVWLKRNR